MGQWGYARYMYICSATHLIFRLINLRIIYMYQMKLPNIVKIAGDLFEVSSEFEAISG